MSITISALICSATLMLFWAVYSLFTDVTEEDRSFMDKPPKGFIYLWFLIKPVSSGYDLNLMFTFPYF